MKAGIASSRVRALEERESKRIENAEKLYSIRQKDAEKRHESYIQVLK